MLGETLGNYRIVGKIGQGGMGAVYQAEHALIGRRAAIKVLLPELSSRSDVVRRFFNEARAIANLNHPAIIDIFDFGFHTDGSGYIVMELLEGESLGARLKRVGSLASSVAVNLTRQIATAMSVAHSHGVVHRDLKPDNLFLVPDRTGAPGELIKILDFGVAKLAGVGSSEGPGVTNSGTLLGTPLYMAPEQCRGAGMVDARADVYALGCVAYHMLCGQPPFVYDFPGELIAAHQLEAPRPLRLRDAVVAPELEAVILRTLAKRPDERPQSMQQLLDELERATTAPDGAPGRRQTLRFGGTAPRDPALAPGTAATAAATPRHTGRLPKKAAAGDAPAAPVTRATRTLPSANTTLGRNMGEVASTPSPRRYWVTGVAALATVGLGALLISDPSAKQATAEAYTAPVMAPAAGVHNPEPVVAPKPVPATAPPPVVLATAPSVTARPDEAPVTSPRAEPTSTPARAGEATDSPPSSAAAEQASVTFKIEGAREPINVQVDGKSILANAPIQLPRDRAIHTVRVTSAHFSPETFSKRADSNRTLHLKNDLRLLTAPGN